MCICVCGDVSQASLVICISFSVYPCVCVCVCVWVPRHLPPMWPMGPQPLCPLLQDSDRVEEPEPLLGRGIHHPPAPGFPPSGLLRAGRGHGGVCVLGTEARVPEGGWAAPKQRTHPPALDAWARDLMTRTLTLPTSPQA